MLHVAFLAVVVAVPGYEVALHEAGWQARNPAQGFRVTFTGEGMTLDDAGWEWGLTLLRFGRPESPEPVSAGAFAPLGRRVERTRPGIVEWYVNSREGLEHGFTIAAPPRGSMASSEVFVEMSLSGSLSPTFSTDGQAIDFRGVNGSYALRYAKLVVVDAAGMRLPARLEGFTEPGVRGIRIRFDDEGARYPVTIDPMTTTAAWMVESNVAGAALGGAVATAGDVNGDGYSDAVVAAPGYGPGREGRVFVYHGSASGLSSTPAWTIDGDQTQAYYGSSVGAADVNGDGYDDLLVGAQSYNPGVENAGRADVYMGSASGLSTTAAWSQVGAEPFGYVGSIIARAGDVNADGYDDVLLGEAGYSGGRVLLYLGSASGLAATPAWSVGPDQAAAGLGGSAGTAGDVNADGYDDVILGAVGFPPASNRGRVWVYLGSASGLSPTAVWFKDSDQFAAGHGASVGTAGDVNGDGYADILIGSPNYSNGQSQEGRVWLYHGTPSGPANVHAWFGESNQADALYGSQVSTAGDVNADGYSDVVVGAPWWDSGILEQRGKVWVYLGSPNGLANAPIISPEGSLGYSRFGSTVATAGDVNGDGFSDVLVGAPLYKSPEIEEGAAFLYYGAASAPPVAPSWPGEGGQTDARYGDRVASAGDVDGDGYSEVLVAATNFSGPLGGEGRVYLYKGSAQGLGDAPAWVLNGDQFVEAVGSALAPAGDVNGDGYSDVLVGSPSYDAPAASAGRARLFLGSAAGLATSPTWTLVGTGSGQVVGNALGSAGDVNGDGYSDVVVNAFQQLRLFLGSLSGLPATPSWVGPAAIGTGIHAPSVGSAGDVNGDGRSDVIVGSPGTFSAALDAGQARLYLGTATGISTTAVWTYDGSAQGESLGASVSSAGDVNGDGYSDVIVGAPFYTNDQSGEGRAVVFLGSAAGLSTTPAWSVEGNTPTSYFGGAVAGMGDLNLDGYGDVAVGGANPNFTGFVRIYLGSAAGLATSPAAVLDAPTFLNGDRFGWSVANAGDLNGDSFPDVIVGAPYYTNPSTREGGAFAHYGNGATGFDRHSRQYQIDGSGPIHFLGKSTAETGFRIAERAISPAGRSKIRLEWEVKPLGAPFDGVGIGSTPLADSGIPGPGGSVALYSQIVSGLGEGGHYKWRTRITSGNPLFPRSPWKSLPNNSLTEAKLRTAGCTDLDGDGYGSLIDASCAVAATDCDDGNGLVWATPGLTTNLRFLSKVSLTWNAPAALGGASTEIRYDTLRSSAATTFSTCVESNDGPNTNAPDVTNPLTGQAFYFLNRARNACPNGVGSLGTTSAGVERVGSVCP